MILTTKLCELKALAMELYPWFDVDKVKSYAVYVWTKDEEHFLGENVFDIYPDRLQFYTCHTSWVIPNEAMPIIKKIQDKLMEIENYLGGLTNE